MNRLQLEKSLRLWNERKARFYKNWMSYKKKKLNSPRRAYWYGQFKLASEMAARRNLQISKLPVASVTKVLTKGVNLIKEFEGFPNGGLPYKDPVGIWTIGYGHIEGVGPNLRRLTEPQASDLLQQDLDRKYAPYVANLQLPLNQNQFDALVSFVYNVGPGGIASSTGVGKNLRARNWAAAADHLLDWDKAGGSRLAGLTRRRQAERKLFLS